MQKSIRKYLFILMLGAAVTAGYTSFAPASMTSFISAQSDHHQTAEMADDHSGHMQHSAAVAATHTAAASGDWSNPATWQGGQRPTANATVSIPAGLIVTVNSVVEPSLKSIAIDGTLRFAPDTDTQLKVGTLTSSTTGHLEIGTAEAPIAADVNATIIFADHGPITKQTDPTQLSRGAILMGKTTIYGAEKAGWSTLAVPPVAGSTTLQLSAPQVGWQVGDQLVIATTDPQNLTGDEKVTITAIDETTITINTPLQWDHVPPKSDLDVHIANLTRNVQFSSENPALKHRGHIMFMHTLDVDVNYARFYQLGRTDKTEPLDDFTWPDLEPANQMALAGNNIRGRYSVHFHRGGVDPATTPARVAGSVVEDDPGWAYVNHSSNVDFVGNVSYNIVGGAYQTEAGDEIGSFVNNIALRTVNPDLPLLGQGVDTEAVVDIREDRMDFAFQGDGFWLHSGTPIIEGNVVSGASGHAFIYWPEGLIEDGRGITKIDPTTLPNGNLLGNSNPVNVWWAPITSFKGNTAYASVKGLEIYYLQATFLLEDEGENPPTDTYIRQLNSTFSDTTLWGMSKNALGVHYAENLTFRNFRIVGNLDPNWPAIDVNQHHNIGRYRFENFTVEDSAIGMVVPPSGRTVIEGGTFSNQVDFLISNPQLEERQLLIDGVQFGTSAAIDPSKRVQIELAADFSPYIEVQTEARDEDFGKNPEFFTLNDEIILNFGRFQNSRIYFNEQAPSYVPMTSENAKLFVNEFEGPIPSELVGRTNQQLQAEVESSFGGKLLPDDAITVPEITGGKATNVISTSANMYLPLVTTETIAEQASARMTDGNDNS